MKTFTPELVLIKHIAMLTTINGATHVSFEVALQPERGDQKEGNQKPDCVPKLFSEERTCKSDRVNSTTEVFFK